MESTTTTPPHAFPHPQAYGHFTTPPTLSSIPLTVGNASSQGPLVPWEANNRAFLSPETALSLTVATPRPKPRRKPDPITSKSTPPCTECGKHFSSWKALFGHMRCHPERQWRGINPPPNSRHHPNLSPSLHKANFTDEEYDVAAGLIMLANGPPKEAQTPAHSAVCATTVRSLSIACRVECKSCGRTFGSQQALGRHRASHKCVKASVSVVDHSEENYNKRSWEESMMILPVGIGHKCNVCFRGFASGQALGGHMRCHWEKGEDHVLGSSSSSNCPSAKFYLLDLNLPPPLESNGDSSSTPSPALDLKLGVS